MHPGWANTPGVEKSLPGFHKMLLKQLRSPQEGADTIIWAAASNEVLSLPTSSFLFDRQVARQHLPLANTWVQESVVNEYVTVLDEYVQKYL